MNRTSLVAVIVSSLVIIGLIFYLAGQRADETERAPVRVLPGPSTPAAEGPDVSSTLVSCAGPATPQASIAALDSRYKWAQSMLKTNHVDGGLAELRNIAAVDPGYPAINSAISTALLKNKKTAEARDAIKLQIEISDCLAELPSREVENYCQSQWLSEPPAGCSAELVKIRQQAHYEEGLVDASDNPVRVAAAPPKPLAAAPVRVPAPQPAVQAPVAAPVVRPIEITTSEAAEHVGQLARVCGVVVSKHTAAESNGKPTFINLDRSFPNQGFTVVTWDKDASAVGDLPSEGTLCVTGTITMYRSTPEIIVSDAKSWSH